MPLYEYECQADGSRFEVIQKFSDPPVEACPNCGGPVRRLISSAAIQFKGSGWYITDYAKKSSTEAGKDSKDSKSTSSSSSESSTSKSDGASSTAPSSPASSTSDKK
jgi:putative FmdB family regulatory protein